MHRLRLCPRRTEAAATAAAHLEHGEAEGGVRTQHSSQKVHKVLRGVQALKARNERRHVALLRRTQHYNRLRVVLALLERP
jgi:hypothetical protein